MPLDINGYNATFKAFTDFATQSVEAGKSKAVARAGGEGALAGRVITAAKHDWVGIGAGRLGSLKDANNAARDLFRNAIADMFGGVDKIPASVKNAMKLSDYGKGRPLTARRILAVKAAIDADGTAAARSKQMDVASVKPETRAVATGMGYVKAELPKLARAALFLAQATGKSEMDAMREVCTPGSNANRLMNYGGRFMENAENFKDGLRLVDLFKTWHADLSASVADIRKTGSTLNGYDYSSADTPSKLNADSCVNEKTRFAIEKFVFEEIANNPSANLKEQNGETIFGFKNNNASRFFGQGFGESCTSTIANIPPAKREVVFKVFNLFCSMAEKPEDHKIQAKNRFFDTGTRCTLLGRVLRHFDEIAAMDAKGTLNAKNVIKTCCPDIVKEGETGNWDLKAVRGFFSNISVLLRLEPEEGGKYSDMNVGQIEQLMNSTGGTLDEVVGMLKGGKKLPNAQYVSEGQMSLDDFGTVEGGRKALHADLDRGVGYVSESEKKLYLGKHADFGFNFPGEERFVTNGSAEGTANIDKVGDKVEKMCGPVHVKQAAVVMTMLSQSGLGVIRGGLEQYGIKSEEHSVVDFTLSRNEESGDVTIHYTSPKELPFAFEWTATVDVDGKVSTTPLTFMDAQQVADCKAGVEDAVQNMQDPRGTHNLFFKDDKARAVPLIETMMHATGGDKDVINLLKDTYVCTSLLYNFANNLRPADVILSRVARLKENVAELREATKGNPAMFKMGLSRLAGLGGKPVPKGMLASLVKAVNAADIGKLRKLSAASTTPVKMNAAIVQYHAAVGQAIKKSGILAMFDGDVGGEEMLGMSMLAGGLVAARLGQDALRSIKGALESPVAGQLQAIYTDLSNEDLVEAGVPKHEATIMKRTVSELSSDILSLLDNVNATLGVEGGDVPAFTGSLDDLDGFDDIAIEIRDMTNKVHADLIQMERERNEAIDAQKKAGASRMQGGNLVIEP